MKRLVRPLVYILGFSVFCSCTTTKWVSRNDFRQSDGKRILAVVLGDGTRLELRSARMDSEDLRGLIAPKDSLTFSRYVVLARPERNDQIPVVIPRSDITTVRTQETDWDATVAVTFGILGLTALIVGFIVWAKNFEDRLWDSK